jgi:hypothetical protein
VDLGIAEEGTGKDAIGVNLRFKSICQREVLLVTKYKDELLSCFYTEFKSDADKQSIYGAIQSSFFVPLKPNF